jgi:hypothetical protein
MGLGAGLDRTENLASTGIQTQDRPARIESLYRLSYPGCHMGVVLNAFLPRVLGL